MDDGLLEPFLEGMTITGGTGPWEGQRNGGGIASTRTNLTVKDAVITGNEADGSGGGVSVVFGTATVIDSVVSNNTAHALSGAVPRGGGGIRSAGNPPSVLVVKHSVIAGNVSYGEGGGLLISSTPTDPAGKLVVIKSIVTGNTALGNAACGDGIYVGNSSLDLHGTEIVGNAPGDTCPYP